MISEMTYVPKIGLAIVIWDDPRGLTRIFEQSSVWDFDAIFIFDGKFSMYKGKQEFPDLEVYRIVEDWAKTKPDTQVYYTYISDHTEAEKRNQAFWFVGKKNMDWVVICDSDEYVIWDKQKFLYEIQTLETNKYSCFGINLDHFGHIGKRPRLFFKPFQHFLVQHEDKPSHSTIYSTLSGTEVVDEIKHTEPLESIKLYHDKTLRSKAKLDEMDKYRKIKNH